MVSEDKLLGWKKSLGNSKWGHSLKKKQKAIKEKWSGEWGHLVKEKKTVTNIYWEKKKDYYKQKIVVSEDKLLGWKKILRK